MLRMVEIIEKKCDGLELSAEEISFVVDGYTSGELPDYQVAALLMAVRLNGMTDEETYALTGAMLRSGATLDLSGLGRPAAGRHSTGGVGDKSTLLSLVIAASAGIVVPMIAGRGLGFTGGTLDKIESIPGFRTDLSLGEFRGLLERHGAGLIAATPEIVPADRRLYALRDATSTVSSIPLICSSVMSKKLAEGLGALVLDVKVGSGTYMKTEEDGRRLAAAMVAVGRRHGTNVVALLTRMDQPLGRAIGNALEIAECVSVLRGEGPEDVAELSVEVAAHMIALGLTALGGLKADVDAARRAARERLDSGAALERFRRFVEAQGGDARVVDEPGRLPRAPVEVPATAGRSGFVRSIDGEAIGWAAVRLGAGRTQLSEDIDRSVGLVLDAKIGDEVRAGDAVCRVFASDEAGAADAAARAAAAYSIADTRTPGAMPVVIERFG